MLNDKDANLYVGVPGGKSLREIVAIQGFYEWHFLDYSELFQTVVTKSGNDLQRPTTIYNDLQRSTTTYFEHKTERANIFADPEL